MSVLASACVVAFAAMAGGNVWAAGGNGGTGTSGATAGGGGTTAQGGDGAAASGIGSGGGGGGVTNTGAGANGGTGASGGLGTAAGGTGGAVMTTFTAGNRTVNTWTTGQGGGDGADSRTSGNARVDGGAGGGGGGAAGAISTTNGTLTITSTLSGGSGGDGGAAGARKAGIYGRGGGGGGGQGGTGLLSTSGGSVTVTGTVKGGNGGAGGSATLGNGGSGGGGGTGIEIGGTRTLTNSGTIEGGAGGVGGASSQGGSTGQAGAGGTAIKSNGGVTVVNSGNISGGLDGSGGNRADAIQFSGGGNTLELQAGSSISGNVVATSGGTDRLILGGAANSTFNVADVGPAAQYRNFATFAKTGSSTWTLSGTTSAVTPWTVQAGTLSIAADGSLGATSGALTLNGGTLNTSATFTSTRAVTLGAAGGTVDTNGATMLTLSGTVSGSGRLTKQGAGTLVLTGSDNSNGGTTISAGTLQVGNGGTSGSITGNVIDNGSLAFNRSDTSTFAGTISGNGSVQQIGTGRTTLSGTNSYSGGTSVTAGTLSVASDANLGNASGGVTLNGGALNTTADFASGRTVTIGSSGGAINTDNATTLTLGGVVSGGAGQLTKQGNGTLVLTGNSTYGGGTTISGGTLQIGNGGVTGSITGNVMDHGALVFNRLDDTVFDGIIQGTGSVTKAGTGTLTLTGVIATTGAATIQSGTLQVGNGGTTGGLTSNVVNDGSLVVNRSDDVIYAGVVSGSGSATKLGAGTLTLTGDSNYTGGSTVAAGTLQLGNGGTTGSIKGNVTNNGALVFNRSDDITFDGAIQGAGSVTKQGGGTLVLTANNTYGGQTTISAGTLQLGDGGIGGSITSDVINNNGTLAFNRADNASYAGSISGTGSVTKNGTGTTTLSGFSTYSGGTTVTGGMLRVDGALVNSTVDVKNGGTLTGAGSIANAVSIGDGATLRGTSGQTLTTGALTLASGSTVNAVLGAPGSQALFQVDGALTLDGQVNVTDLGGFGAGVYRLMNYTGALTDNGLEVGTAPAGSQLSVQTAVARQVNLVNTAGQTLSFWDGVDSANLNNGSVDGGGGTWTANGNSWTTSDGSMNAARPAPGFAVFQNQAGTVTIDNSRGAVSVTGMQFAADGYVVNGDPLTLSGTQAIIRVGEGSQAPVTAVVNAELTGSARLQKTDHGTLVLAGNNSYTGGTLISDGTLQLGNGGTTGSIHGDVTNNGTLAFNRSDDVTFAGTITGSGAVKQIGSGTTTLTGANSYGGGTTINGGKLVASAGSLGSGAIVDNAALEIRQASNATMGNAISGNGSITKTGAGALNYTGNGGAFTGSTLVQAGTLAVNGSLGGTLTMASGTTLKGNGTIGTTVVQSGATVAPGNSIGTLNVAGNLTLAQGSTYQVEASADGRSDQIRATGTIALQGGTLSVMADGNWNPATSYSILNAVGGVTGAFGTVTTNFAFLDPSISYDAKGATLNLKRNDVSFSSVGTTANERASGAAVQAVGAGTLFDAVVQLDAPTAARAFRQLTGELHASVKSATIEDSRFVRDAGLDRTRQALGGVVGSADMNAKNGVWARTFGSWGDMRSDGNASPVDRSTSGILIGGDTQVGDDWRVGALGGYSRANVDVHALNSSASSDSYHLGVYGGKQWGALGLRAGASYTDSRIDTTRVVSFTGFADLPTASYKSRTAQVFGELGWRIEAGTGAIEPFAGLAYVNLHTDDFAERGGSASLRGGGDSTDTTFSTLGIRGSNNVEIGSMKATVHGMLGWRHAFGNVSKTSQLALVAQPAAFTVAGVPIANNVAVVEGGLDLALKPNLTLGISYIGQFANRSEDHSVKADLVWKF